MVVVLLWGGCSHLLGRFFSWGQACSPPSCGTYRSRAILGSNILAVFRVISPAWGRGKGLTLSINHFFFPPPICSVIPLLLHAPLIFDHFISLSAFHPLLVDSWASALLAPSFLQRCYPMTWFSPVAPLKKKRKKRKIGEKLKKYSEVPSVSFHSPWTLFLFLVVSTFSQSYGAHVGSACFHLLLFVPSPAAASPTPPPPPSLPAAFTSLLALLGNEEPGHLYKQLEARWRANILQLTRSLQTSVQEPTA